jgi:hypothetical protein
LKNYQPLNRHPGESRDPVAFVAHKQLIRKPNPQKQALSNRPRISSGKGKGNDFSTS